MYTKNHKSVMALALLLALSIMISLQPMTAHVALAAPAAVGVPIPDLTVPLDLIEPGDRPLELRVLTEPTALATVANTVWHSSNPEVATVTTAVRTISNVSTVLGVITLHGEGTTEISVTVDGVLSTTQADADRGIGQRYEKCVLTVTAPENLSMANKNLRRVPSLPSSASPRRVDRDYHLGWPANYGEARVALWYNDATAAFTIGADDIHADEYWRWKQIYERWGVPVSIVTNPGWATNSAPGTPSSIFGPWSSGVNQSPMHAWEFVASGAGEIQNHGYRHEQEPRNLWTTGEHYFDITESKRLIQERVYDMMPQATRDTLPLLIKNLGAQTHANGNPVDLSKKYFSAGRLGSGPTDGSTDAGTTDSSFSATEYGSFQCQYTQADNIMANPDSQRRKLISQLPAPPLRQTGVSANSWEWLLRGFIDRTILNGTSPDTGYVHNQFAGHGHWNTHQINDIRSWGGVGGLQSGLYHSDVLEFVYENYITQNLSLIWPDTITNVTNYSQERDSVMNSTYGRFEVTKATATEINIEMEDYLDDWYFDHPLTIKVALDNSWTKLEATQLGNAKYPGVKPLDAKLVKKDGKVFAIVNAIPDRGTVVIKNEGAVFAIPSDATLKALEYRFPVGQFLDDSNPRRSVPSFNPATRTYNVTLPPSTDKVAIYATLNDEKASFVRDPIMGTIYEMSAAKGVMPATVTVTADDGTELVYTINFTVAPYANASNIAIASNGNLAQNAISERVTFSLDVSPASDEFSSWYPVGQTDPNALEWYVRINDEPVVKQDNTGAITFAYTPVEFGTHAIYAVSGGVKSDEVVITFDRGEIIPKMVFLDIDFEDSELYVVGQPIPTTSDMNDTRMFDDPNMPKNAINTGDTNIRLGDQGAVVEYVPGLGNVLAWHPTSNGVYTGLAKTYQSSSTEPIVFAFKTRATNRPRPAAVGGDGFEAYHTNQWDKVAGAFCMASNGNLRMSTNWFGGDWRGPYPEDWFSVIQVIEPGRRNDGGNPWSSLMFGRSSSDTFNVHSGFFVYTSQGAMMDALRAVGFTLRSGYGDVEFNPAVTANFLTDVEIYRPGSFVMTAAKETFNVSEPIRMDFSQHYNPNTLTQQRVKVTNIATGANVPIQSITKDRLDYKHFLINFAPGVLQDGERYSVSLDDEVRDVIDKTVYGDAEFTVTGFIPPPDPELNISKMALTQADGTYSVAAAAENSFTTPQPIDFWVAVYSAGKLINVEKITQNIAVGTGTHKFNFTLPASAVQNSQNRVKVMAWQAGTVIPLCASVDKTIGGLMSQEVTLTYSHISEEINPPAHSRDGDLATRYAFRDEGWILYEWAMPIEVSKVQVATWQGASGDDRKTKLAILVSEDGIKFEEIFNGETSVIANEMEDFPLPTPKRICAVKVIGYGNTSASSESKLWTSLLEVAWE